MPVVVVGSLDQDISQEMGIRYPHFYIPGIKNLEFTKTKLTWSVLNGIYASLVMMVIGLGNLNLKMFLCCFRITFSLVKKNLQLF